MSVPVGVYYLFGVKGRQNTDSEEAVKMHLCSVAPSILLVPRRVHPLNGAICLSDIPYHSCLFLPL